MTAVRSSRQEVRNPVLALPAARKLRQLPPETRTVLTELFRELAADARVRAQTSWHRNKGPMAAYWKAVGAYAEHIRRVVRP